MKKFAFILGLVLIAGALAAAGFWLGLSQRFLANTYSITALDRFITDASMKTALLQELDSGKIDEARTLLRSDLDGDILSIWELGDYSDTRNRRMITNLFSRINSYRAEYPQNYTNHTSEDEALIDSKIASILEQATKAESK